MNPNINRAQLFILFYLYDNWELMRKVYFRSIFNDAAKFGRGYCHKKYHYQISLTPRYNSGVYGF